MAELSPKERMKIKRQSMDERDPKERSKNFKEVNLGFDFETAKKEATRCIQCKKPHCIAGCPVHIDIPAFIKEVELGNIDKAAKILKKDNLLPAVCGRVCPQEEQCEIVCTLA